jgi:outer membrane protein assembly factor BamB
MRSAMLMAGCVVLLGANGVRAQDWPQWRGPNRDGRATGFKAPASWPKELTKKWTVTVGGGDATPALVGDKLYVFARPGGGTGADEVLHCLDAATGKDLWQDKYAVGPATGPAGGIHAGPRGSPAVADGKVVTLGARGTLSCYDAADGKLLWRKDDFKGYWPQFYASCSPLLVDGLCIAQVGGLEGGRGRMGKGAIVAYDLATGAEKWKSADEGPAYSSPALLTAGGAKLIVAETAGKVVAVNAADGKLAWEAPFPAARMQYNAPTPIVVGPMLIYAGGGRGLTAVQLEKKGDRFEAKELWASKDVSVQFNTPVLKDGLLFGLSAQNQLFCVNAKDGKLLWSAALPAAGGGGGGRGRGSGFGSVVAAGPVLMALSPAAQLVVFEPSNKELKTLARYKVADSQTYAYPVVSGNRVFIKDDNSVTLWTID